jgi:hypothetical protein
MTFTVAVERKPPDEQFAAEDIKLFHEECGGGEITRSNDCGWLLRCKRCHISINVEVSKDGTALLMKTATDGKTHKIKSHYEGKEEEIVAVPRT